MGNGNLSCEKNQVVYDLKDVDNSDPVSHNPSLWDLEQEGNLENCNYKPCRALFLCASDNPFSLPSQTLFLSRFLCVPMGPLGLSAPFSNDPFLAPDLFSQTTQIVS
jgi:hypothetical protein